MDNLKSIIEKETDGYMKNVSFNYDKYKAIGTPYDVWLNNVSRVERELEAIIAGAPWTDEYPLIHLRNDEKDDSGTVVKVTLSIYGRKTIVNAVLNFLSQAEDEYVFLNTIAVDEYRAKAEQILKETQGKVSDDKYQVLVDNFEKAKQLVNLSENNDIEKSITPKGAVSVVAASKEEAISKVKEELLKKGLTIKDEQITYISVQDHKLSELKQSSDSGFTGVGPIDFSAEDELEEIELPKFIMPNPDPDDYN